MTTQPAPPAAFDAIAARYDEIFTCSQIGEAQRASVWRTLDRTFQTGTRVLEIGCGTGIDAAFLADRGVRVVATDSSAQMIEMTTQRIRHRDLQAVVQPLQMSAENLANLPVHDPFDGAFSNFGALNCVEDLHSLAHNLALLLKPGASAVLCWMGPLCLWEILWYLCQGKTAKAFRRMHYDGVNIRIADGAPVKVRYPSPRTLKRAFAPEFRLKSFKGVGVAVPPSYLEPWAQRFPRILECCRHADSFLGQCPGLRVLADHILLTFQRAS